MYLFSNILGVFVFDDSLNVVNEILFKGIEDYQNKNEFIQKIQNKNKNLKEPDNDALKKILTHFKNRKYFNDFYNKNLELTKLGVKNSVADRKSTRLNSSHSAKSRMPSSA